MPKSTPFVSMTYFHCICIFCSASHVFVSFATLVMYLLSFGVCNAISGVCICYLWCLISDAGVIFFQYNACIIRVGYPPCIRCKHLWWTVSLLQVLLQKDFSVVVVVAATVMALTQSCAQVFGWSRRIFCLVAVGILVFVWKPKDWGHGVMGSNMS